MFCTVRKLEEKGTSMILAVRRQRQAARLAISISVIYLLTTASVFSSGRAEIADQTVPIESYVIAPGPELSSDERFLILPHEELTWVAELPLERGPGPVLFLGDQRYVVGEHRGGSVWFHDDGVTQQIVRFGNGPNEILSVTAMKRIDDERFFIYGNVNDAGGSPRMLIFNTAGEFLQQAAMSGVRYNDVSVSVGKDGEVMTIAIGKTLLMGEPGRGPFPGAVGEEAARRLGDDDDMVHVFEGLGTAGALSATFHSRMNNKIQVPATFLGILYSGDAFVDAHEETLYVTGQKARYLWSYDREGTLIHRLEHDVARSWWRDSEPVAGDEDNTFQLVYADVTVDERGIAFLGSSNGRYPFILAAPGGSRVAAVIGPKENLWYVSAWDGRLIASGGPRNGKVTVYDYRAYRDLWMDLPE